MQNEARSGMTLPMPAKLRASCELMLREGGAHDEEEILEAFQRLSAESRYTRFMIPLRGLSPPMRAAATHPVPGRDFALVAVSVDGDDEVIVGVQRPSVPG